jgi:hypothetical protein
MRGLRGILLSSVLSLLGACASDPPETPGPEGGSYERDRYGCVQIGLARECDYDCSFPCCVDGELTMCPLAGPTECNFVVPESCTDAGRRDGG